MTGGAAQVTPPTRAQILADPLAARVHQVVTEYARLMLPFDASERASGYRDGVARAVIETCIALGAWDRLRSSLVTQAADLAYDDVFGDHVVPLPVVDAIPAGLLPEVNPE